MPSTACFAYVNVSFRSMNSLAPTTHSAIAAELCDALQRSPTGEVDNHAPASSWAVGHILLLHLKNLVLHAEKYASSVHRLDLLVVGYRGVLDFCDGVSADDDTGRVDGIVYRWSMGPGYCRLTYASELLDRLLYGILDIVLAGNVRLDKDGGIWVCLVDR